MAIKDEDLYGVSSRKALASLYGTDTAVTYKITADVTSAVVPALSPVVIAADGSAKVYAAESAAPEVGETDQVALLASDRVSDAAGKFNGAVMRQAHVRRPLLSTAAKTVLSDAPAESLKNIIVEEA